MASQPIPTLQFDSTILPADQQMAAQRGFMPAFAIDAPEADRGFFSRSTAWMLGPMVLNYNQLGPVTIARAKPQLRDNADHYVLVALFSGGPWEGDFDGREVHGEIEEVVVLDMTRPMRTVSPLTTSVTILIPRSMLDEVLPPFDMHGLVLNAPAGKLLSDYIRALIVRLPALEAADAVAIARGTRDLIAATLSTARRHAPTASGDSALLVRAKRHVSRHLSTELDADKLCAALATSRSSLFRAFEPLGGLARHVRTRRLAHAHELLSRPDESRTVAEIAFASGFKSPAHFSRAFREVYGHSPTDLQDRRAMPALPPPGPAGDTHLAYAEWHKRLR